MGRTVSELKKEFDICGLTVEPKMSVDEMRAELAQYYWSKENPNVAIPFQSAVMLARDASKFTLKEFHNEFDLGNWKAELKLNGCRGILILEDGKTPRMTSRRRSDKHHRFEENIDNVPQFRDCKWNFSGRTVIDGELVHELQSIITSEGTKTESQLQTSVAMINSESSKGIAMQQKYGNLKYWIFDVLWLNGVNLQDETYLTRRAKLEEFFSNQNIEDLEICPQYDLIEGFVLANGERADSYYQIYQQMVADGFEGIMLKANHGKYITTGRPKIMYKMKRRVTFDAFVTGFVPATEGKGFENYIGALEVSAFIDGKECAIGAIASIDLETRKDATVYLDGKPSLNPKYLGRCMEIKGQEVTKNGRLCHCQMIEWRPDKSPSDCQILGSLYFGTKE